MYVDMSQIREEIRVSHQPGREDDINVSFCTENEEDMLIFLLCNLWCSGIYNQKPQRQLWNNKGLIRACQLWVCYISV